MTGPAHLTGVRVGHWSDASARTGCTVVLLPAGTVASGEVRGGAPGTREWALLAPERTVARVDAVFLSGGSAYGLAVGDGVARWCEERGIGYPTSAGPVPIVVGAVLFDLDVGDGRHRPGADEGYAACVAAEQWTGDGRPVSGRVGAGTGAMIARGRGPAGRRRGGIGVATRVDGDVIVGALMAVNAIGDVVPWPRSAGEAGDAVGAGGAGEAGGGGGPGGGAAGGGAALEATTIGVVVTNASLDKLSCLLVAQSAHDGMARALEPVHTTRDGDAVVAAATGPVDVPVDLVRVLAAGAVEGAIRAAVRSDR